jgi:RNA polymerase sigma factor (TIGR02999 family)
VTHQTNVTALLHLAAAGDRDSFDRAFGLLYDELQRLARAQLRREVDGHTLNTGALVHEAYLRLGDGSSTEWRDSAHFMAIAATAMRRVLVDHARRFRAAKRDGVAHAVSLDAVDTQRRDVQDDSLVDLDDALVRLAELDARQAQVVECRFFAGYTEEETAKALDIGLRTVKRDWAKARSWLFRELDQRTTS